MKVHNWFFTRRTRLAISFGIAAILFTVFGASASAQIWSNADGDGNWLNGLNWVGGFAPTGNSDDAVVGAPSPVLLNGSVDLNSLTVDVDGIVNLGGSLNLDFGGTGTTTLNNAGTINTGNNSDFQFQNTVINSGNININATSTNTDIEIDTLGATLDGGGTVTLNGANAGINGLGGSTLTIVDQTIQGQGSIGENTIGIVNQANGLIDSNVSGQLLSVDSSAAGASNAGTMQASGGGVLRILDTDVDNTSGQIIAQNGSEVRMFGSTISNGTLSSVGTGQLTVDGSADVFFEDVTINGNMVSQNNSDTGFSGTITNTGTVQIAATSTNTDIEVQAGGATLTGGGTVQLSGANAGINGVGTLTIGDHTIEGEGSIGENAIGIVNSSTGVINANVSTKTLTVDTNVDGVDNKGVMKASNEGTLRFLGSNVTNDGALIEAGADSTVSFNASAITGGTLNSVGTGQFIVEGSSDVRFEDITNNGNIVTLNNSDTELLGTINNTGSIEILATSTNTDLEVQTGGAILTGGGTVKLSGTNAGINGLTGTVLTIGDQTIGGEGSIGENTIGIINSATGLVDANVSGQMLNIDADATNNFTNDGTLRASDGGVLRISATQMSNNNMIEALNGSKIELNESTVTGGTLRSVDSGFVEILASTTTRLQDLTFQGNMQSLNNSDTEISGTIDNQGLMEIISTSANTDIEVQAGGATLTGGGTVRLSGSLAGVNGSTGAVLDIASQIVIGEGSLGENSINIQNGIGGTIEADVMGGTLTIDPISGSTNAFINDGTLRASNGAKLDSVHFLLNHGTIDTGTGSEVEAFSLTNTVGSLLSGDGIVDVQFGPISVAGTVAPGNSAGNLTMLDDTVFSSTAALQTELESASLFDVLTVQGELTLDGELSVDLLGGFNPFSADSFQIAFASEGITGEFMNVSDGGTLLTEGGEGTFMVNYNSSSVVLSNFTLSAVPEPNAALCLIGLGIGLVFRRRRQV